MTKPTTLQQAIAKYLTQPERAFLFAALHTEGVLSDDKETEAVLRAKLGLEKEV